VVSELKIRAYHFLMEEIRSVYGSIRATPSPRDSFVATTLYTRRLLLLSGPFPFPKAARGSLATSDAIFYSYANSMITRTR
jgi:hypothetical protein